MTVVGPLLVVVGLLVASANWYGLIPPTNVPPESECGLLFGLVTAAGGVILFLVGLVIATIKWVAGRRW
jgi:hypothetical protein